jgi:3-(3-hydroxy-phenyl)propionate hydroxylase
MLETEVLIVGAGPTGLTLANALGRDGVKFVIVDRKPGTITEPRAVSIDDESLRTMQAIGLSDAVMRDVVPGYGVHYLTKKGGRCFARVEPTASEYGFPRRNAFRQPHFEATLNAGLRRFPFASILFGHELESFTQDKAAVTGRVRRTDGSELSIRARYLVACDGGRSPVREMLNLKMVGSTFKSRWLVIDTEEDDDDFTQMRVYCDPTRAVIDVPGPHRTRRFELLLQRLEQAEEILAPKRIAELLLPFRGDRATHIVRKTVYTFHARVAERWQVDRVFLAGDAAHLTPPYAGQGMNSGVRDAHNLGWKLAAVAQGRLPPAVLQSYEPERRAHAWALIRLALNLGIVMAPSSRLSAWLWQSFFSIASYVPPVRDYFLQMKFKPTPRFSKGLLGPPDRLGKYSIRGRMLPQPMVRGPQGSRRLDDLIGHRFALIYCAPRSAEAPPSLSHPLWKSLDAEMIWLGPKGDDPDRSPVAYSGWQIATESEAPEVEIFRRQRGRIIVLRPDRYAAGSFAPAEEQSFANGFAEVLGLFAPGAAFGPQSPRFNEIKEFQDESDPTN